MGKKTPLYEAHLAAGAKIVDFGGWDMPLHYGSQLEEHHVVRRAAGMFDVSHMTISDLKGPRSREFLRYLLANNVDRLQLSGKALYTCMLNEQGGVIDDLIVYFMDESWFRVVTNAATHDKDLAWIKRQALAFNVEVVECTRLAMIAVQGPEARDKVHALLTDALRTQAQTLTPFSAAAEDLMFIGRTGYTGEDGYEIILPASAAPKFWSQLLESGVQPCGLGARDTLRLEAGMALYGAEMDESTTPLETGLAWTVGWEPKTRHFIGRDILMKQREQGAPTKQVGLILDDKGVLRGHQAVYLQGTNIGEITSGGFAPTLGKSIALARVAATVDATACQVEIRGKQLAALIVKPPFVRHGKACI